MAGSWRCWATTFGGSSKQRPTPSPEVLPAPVGSFPVVLHSKENAVRPRKEASGALRFGSTRRVGMSGEQFRLEGKAALITGGSKGLGRAIADALAGAGADVCLVSRHGEEGEQAAAE